MIYCSSASTTGTAQKFTGRSDVLMLLRLDKDTGEVKLASFMRDTLVEIEGHDKNRINTAYQFRQHRARIRYDGEKLRHKTGLLYGRQLLWHGGYNQLS